MIAVTKRGSIVLQDVARWIELHRTILTILAVLVLVFILLLSFRAPHFGYVKEFTVGGGIIQDADKSLDMRVVPLVVAIQLTVLFILSIWRLQLSSLLVGCFHLIVGLTALTVFEKITGPVQLALYFSLITATWVCYLASGEGYQRSGSRVILAAAGLTLVLYHFVSLDPVLCFSVAALSLSVLLFRWNVFVERWLASAGTLVVAVVFGFAAPIFWYGAPNQHYSPIDFLHLCLSLLVIAEAARIAWYRSESRETFASCLAVALAFSTLLAPNISSAALPIDDYHFGEKLLAAQALFESNRSWFITFFSPHGLSDTFGAIVAWSIGDLTGTGVFIGESLFPLYPAIFLSWLFIRRIGALPAFALAILFPFEDRSVLMLSLTVLLASEVACVRSPRVAGALAVVVVAAGVFLNAGLGVAGGIVGYVAGLVVQARRGERCLAYFVGSSCVAVIFLVILFSRQILGQLYFIAVSANANLTIYGNGNITVIFEHLSYFLFALAPMLAVLMYYGSGRDSTSSVLNFFKLSELVALVVPPAVFAIVMNSYAAARLDGTAPRALFATLALLVFLPTWLALFRGSRYSVLSVSWLCILLIALVSPWPLNLRSDKPLLPEVAVVQAAAIDDELPRLGFGTSDLRHLELIREVSIVVEELLEPGETFLNLTNRNSLSFYLERAISMPFPSTYNAAPERFQMDDVDALKKEPPPLALVAVDNIEHDGLKLSLRSPRIYEFLLENYDPFIWGQFTYGIRKDLGDRLRNFRKNRTTRGRSEGEYPIGSYSDDHWKNGIAIGSNASDWTFALTPEFSGKFEVGDRLLFSDGVERSIERIEGTNVRTSPTIVGCQCTDEEVTAFTLLNRKLVPTPGSWEDVLHTSDLRRIPSAWGRSHHTLSKVLQPLVQQLSLEMTFDLALDPLESSQYEVSGSDPYWVYVLSKPISPADAGILNLTISCTDQDKTPLVQVFWRSSDTGFSEYASLTFEASHDRNLVPLYSTPRWSMLPNISEVRIDLSNADECPSVELRDVSLSQKHLKSGL